MIQLHSDCLVFETDAGERVPMSAQELACRLLPTLPGFLDREQVLHAIAAVVYFFRNEQQRDSVRVTEFAAALDKVLRELGLNLCLPGALPTGEPREVVADLQDLARASAAGGELVFFTRLREVVQSKLQETPGVLRFNGLREGVKHLLGARRWTPGCQSLHDQIVSFLRDCLHHHAPAARCALVIV